jgi:hypothetical protein
VKDVAVTAQRGGSAHIDDFTARGLPPRSQWPVMTFDLPELRYPSQLNCATVLLGDAIREGHGDSVALRSDAGQWTYAQLLEQSDRIANVLVHDLGIVPADNLNPQKARILLMLALAHTTDLAQLRRIFAEY